MKSLTEAGPTPDKSSSRNVGGNHSLLIAGPGWKGTQPPGVKKVFRCEAEFALAGFRTQLFNPSDLDNVKKVQAGYKVQPLTQFLGEPAPPAAPTVDFIKPLTLEQEQTSPEFFNVLNFVLEFCPTDPSEKELMARFANLNIGAGKNFDMTKLSPEIKKAVEDGMADAWLAFAEAKNQVDEGKVTTGDILGTREYLKNNYMYRMLAGQIGGMSVDSNNHIWVLQRPGSDTPDEIGADPSSPRKAMCCVPAPPVLEFDTEGNLLKFWGGPGNGYDWPDVEHGIFVDRAGSVWIGGNGPTSRQVLKFTNDGKFLKQIGHPSKEPANSTDTTLLGRPAGLEVDEGAHELYISDGYLNKRIIVFGSDTLAFKRMWGGYGNVPNDADPGPYKGKSNAPIDQQFRSPVHCAHISTDGLVYVCDRANDRIQIFTKQGKFLKEFFVRPETLEPGTVCDIAFSRDAGQEYLLVADDTNNVIWTLRRSDGTVLGSTGHDGRNAGQFHAIHQLVSDSAGNLYTGEVETGKRIQKFLLVNGR